jgi:threonine synthase
MSAVTVNDEQTRATIRRVFETHGYVTDPHGAVGYLALENYLQQHPAKKGIFLETAHPVKFPDAVEAETGQAIAIPAMLETMMLQSKQATQVPNDYKTVKDFLLNR